MAENSVMVYKDGRSQSVQGREVQSYLNNGWSTTRPAGGSSSSTVSSTGLGLGAGLPLTPDEITAAFDARKDPNKALTIEALRAQIGGMVPSWVPSSWITDFTTVWANDYERNNPGAAIPQSVQAFTDYNPKFLSGVQWLPVQVAAAKNGTSLPPLFMFRDDNGEEVLYSSSLKNGAYPYSPGPGGSARISDYGPEIDTSGFPVLDNTTLTGLMGSVSSGGGGGGGGGAGRQNIPFDRDKLVEDATNLWSSVLLEPPGNIEGIVDKYMTEANAFWVKSGGSKDFETYLWEQMRATSRHKQLYRWKPEELHEQQFMNQYSGRVAGFGLRPDRQTEQVERSLTSGGSPAGQTKRIGRSREVVVGNQGTFSKGFASTLAGLGPAAWRG